MHGGVALEDLKGENVEALAKGVVNLEKHLENIKKFGLGYVVAINRFHSDTEAEIEFLDKFVEKGLIEDTITAKDLFDITSNLAEQNTDLVPVDCLSKRKIEDYMQNVAAL